MSMLALADFYYPTEEQVKERIAHEFGDWDGPKSHDISEDLKRYDVIVASYYFEDCEGLAYLLLQDKNTKKYYEVNAGHCSCFGLECQYEPEEVEPEYLLSDKFYVCQKYLNQIKEHIRSVVNGSRAKSDPKSDAIKANKGDDANQVEDN